MTARIDWGLVLEEARTIVRSYSTGVTLRQLFYRLVAGQLIPNTAAAYKTLSSKTAEQRRHGAFPDLIDRGRQIHRPYYVDSPVDAISDALRYYRLDRTLGQDVSIYLGVEKAGLVMQLESWFRNLGIPILALGGYSSQTYVKEVVRDVESTPHPDGGRLIEEIEDHRNYRMGRPAVLLYAGDFDPSGEDIDRDFVARTRCWDKVVRVALTPAQVAEYDLPPAMGKVTDSRAARFVERHGELVQVELDALPPDVLQELYQTAIDEFWDESAYEAVCERETADRDRLSAFAATLDPA